MRVLRNLFFTVFLLIGLSLSAFGQQDDEKRNTPPKKGEQPKAIIVPKSDTKPKDNSGDEKPKEDKKSKKPDEY